MYCRQFWLGGLFVSLSTLALVFFLASVISVSQPVAEQVALGALPMTEAVQLIRQKAIDENITGQYSLYGIIGLWFAALVDSFRLNKREVTT